MSEQDQLNRIEAKIDKLDDRQDRMEIIQVAQHATLEDHTRRSTMLEAIVIPLQKKVTIFEVALKVLGGLVLFGSAVAGIVDLILRIVHH